MSLLGWVSRNMDDSKGATQLGHPLGNLQVATPLKTPTIILGRGLVNTWWTPHEEIKSFLSLWTSSMLLYRSVVGLISPEDLTWVITVGDGHIQPWGHSYTPGTGWLLSFQYKDKMLMKGEKQNHGPLLNFATTLLYSAVHFLKNKTKKQTLTSRGPWDRSRWEDIHYHDD